MRKELTVDLRIRRAADLLLERNARIAESTDRGSIPSSLETRAQMILAGKKRETIPMSFRVKILIAAAAILVAAAILCGCVKPIRKKLIRLFFVSQEGYEEIYFDVESSTSAEAEFRIQTPKYLPEGTTLFEEYSDSNSITLVYEYNGMIGALYYFQQRLGDGIAMSANIDTDYTTRREIVFRSCTAYVFHDHKDDCYMLMWADDTSLYEIGYTNTEQELFDIANSIS